MAADPLRAQLETRYSKRWVNQLVTDKANHLAVPRRVAMLALARDLGLNWTRHAKPEEIEAVRKVAVESPAATASAPQPPVAPAKTQPTRPRTAAVPSNARQAARGPRDKVFVVHGRNNQIRTAAFTFLRALDLRPVEWGEAMKATGKPMPYIAETLEEAIRDVAAIVVLITPDDIVQLKRQFVGRNDPDEERKPMGQARPNVLFESGMAFARHAEKTVFLTFGRVKSFTDIGGMHVVRMAETAEKRHELVDTLRTAGADVRTEGRTDWLSAGDFDLKETDDADNQTP